MTQNIQAISMGKNYEKYQMGFAHLLITLMLLAACNAKKNNSEVAIKEKTTAPKKSYPDIESPPEVLLNTVTG